MRSKGKPWLLFSYLTLRGHQIKDMAIYSLQPLLQCAYPSLKPVSTQTLALLLHLYRSNLKGSLRSRQDPTKVGEDHCLDLFTGRCIIASKILTFPLVLCNIYFKSRALHQLSALLQHLWPQEHCSAPHLPSTH